MSPEKRDFQSSRIFPADRKAWLGILIATAVLGPAAWAWRHRRLLPPAPVSAPSDRPFRLLVLEYGRIVEAPDGRHVTRSQMEAQLTMLRERGYVPVTASQVAAAYQKQAALPERALLLVFYGGYLSTYDCVHPLLARLRWPAVMFLQTDRQVERDPVFLYWDRLQVMVDSGLWQLGVHGGRGPALPNGEAAFRASRALVESKLHTPVLAYARLAGITPPLSAHPAAGDGPVLGFQTSLFGINDQDDLPLQLNTFHVDADQTALQLALKLERSLSAPGPDPQVMDRLVSDQTGKVTASPEGLVLEAPRRSAVWLAGSRWVEDWVLEAKVRSHGGQFWFEQEGVRNGPSWRLGGDAAGLHLQERSADGRTATLANFAPVASGAWHDFKLIRRGDGLWIACDGKPLSDRPYGLHGAGHGGLGLVAAANPAPGQLAIADLRFTSHPFLTLPCAGSPGAPEVGALIARAPQTAAISPAWIVLGAGATKETPLNQDLIRMLQSRYAWEVLPEIQFLDRGNPNDTRWLRERMEQAARAGWNGVRLNLDALAEPDRRAWSEAATRLGLQLRPKDNPFKVLTQAQAKENPHEA